METLLTTVDDNILDSLTFQLGSSANYITERRSVSFYPSGSNIYSPGGTTLLKFHLTDDSAWLDPSTLRLQFKLNNVGPRMLKLLNTNPANFFRRVIIRCNGVQIEDLDFYNRLTNMMMHLMPYHKKLNMMGESFPLDDMSYIDDIENYSQFDFKNRSPQVQVGESVTVQMPFLSGLFNCGKYLPLKYLQGLTIELILVNRYKDAALIHDAHLAGEDPLWTISEPVLKCQVVTIDNSLQNGFTQRLLDGKSFPIHFTSFVTQIANAGNTSTPVVSITRAFTRLKAAYITMYKQVYKFDPTGVTPEDIFRTVECDQLGNAKEATLFYHPQYVYNGSDSNVAPTEDHIDRPPIGNFYRSENIRGYYKYNPKCEVSYQVQLGSKVYPVMEVKTSQEAYYELLKTIGAHELSSNYAIDILPREYRSWKHIMGVSFENAPGSSFSGVSTRNGDLLTIKLKGCHHVNNDGTILPYSTPEYIYAVLEADMVLSISDVGVQLFD